MENRYHPPRTTSWRTSTWVDSVIVERWFRNLKSECLRASEYETPVELRRLVAGYVEQ